MGVYHRHGIRQNTLAGVVVGDHHIHAQLTGEGHLIHGGDAAVHSDDQRDALSGQGGDGLPVQAIALLQPAGDIGQHSAPLAGQKFGEQTGGGNAVHIIVPIDRYLLSPLQGQPDPCRRLIHAQHQQRRQKGLPSGGQQLPGLVPAMNAPGSQDGGQQGGQSRPFQGGAKGRVGGRH